MTVRLKRWSGCHTVDGASGTTLATCSAGAPGEVGKASEAAKSGKIESDGGIRWGINGHPIQGGPYSAISLDEQMAMVAKVGLKDYRMDLYDASEVSMDTLKQAAAAGKAHGIQILPILIPDFMVYRSENIAYDAGYAMGKTYAALFKDSIHVWELGNEWDGAVGWANASSVPDGSLISHYNQSNYVLARGMLRGLLDGIHAADPISKGIIDTTGVCHYGFTDGLWADGVHWDITGEHWYKLAGDITNMTSFCSSGPINKAALLLDHYRKPIWVTEFGSNDDPGNKTEMAAWLLATMTYLNSIATKYQIEAGQLYEL